MRQVERLAAIYRLPSSSIPRLSDDERLVICAGERFCEAAFKAISEGGNSSLAGFRFLHIDWCGAELLKLASIYLVADANADLERLSNSKNNDALWLVPWDIENAACLRETRATRYANASDILSNFVRL